MTSVRIQTFASVLALAAGCAKPVAQTTATACPQRVVTWMVCPTPSGVSTGCRVWGEALGCGLDALAIDYASLRCGGYAPRRWPRRRGRGARSPAQLAA